MPTLGETGISKYEADIFYGIVAPAKTPPDTIKELAGWFSKALKAPDMAPKLAQQGLFPVGSCGAEFGAYMNCCPQLGGVARRVPNRDHFTAPYCLGHAGDGAHDERVG